MTREEAISLFFANDAQVSHEYAVTDAERQAGIDETAEALRALGVTEKELEEYV